MLGQAPLRTVHESLPSHGSSLCKASCLTRSTSTSCRPSRYASVAVVQTFACSASQWHPMSNLLKTHQSAVMPLLSFAFPHFNGSPNYLANKDQSDVGPLSCRVTFKPVSAPLQHGIRFFRHPKPAPPSVLPRGKPSQKGTIRGFHVPFSEVHGVRRLFSTGRYMGHEAVPYTPTSHLHCLLAQA